jgi:hypothetical protein
MVLSYRRMQISQQQMAELEASGKDTPDLETALQWERNYRVERQRVPPTVEVKRAWIVPPFRGRTVFVIKATWPSLPDKPEVRYYAVRGNLVATMRETSDTRWKFPL